MGCCGKTEERDLVQRKMGRKRGCPKRDSQADSWKEEQELVEEGGVMGGMGSRI